MSGEKTVMLTDDLPEPVIHQFESIENRTCLVALQGYLASLELGPIYHFTLSLMFPKALLCGFIDFAYEILFVTQNISINKLMSVIKRCLAFFLGEKPKQELHLKSI